MCEHYKNILRTVRREKIVLRQCGPLTNNLKYFRFWFLFRRDMRILVSNWLKNVILEHWCKNEKCSPFLLYLNIQIICFYDIVPLKACAKVLRSGHWLRAVYCAELDSGPYHTARSFPLKFCCLTPRKMILRGTWLCMELDSAQYDTAQNLTPRSIILRGAFTTKFIILHGTWLRAVSYCAKFRKNTNISAKTKPKTKIF